ncbi:molybdenum cofactor sulfurase [Morus notabilis]|nr:molybdenum cofactor sulfurase [Morus notabilis]
MNSSPNCIREASQACFQGCCVKPSFLSLPYESSQPHHSPKSTTTSSTINTTSSTITTASSSQYNFILATISSLHPNTQFSNHESLPSLDESFSHFIRAFPRYLQTHQADQLRSREYYHLALSNHVCLDYIGHGLFSCSSKARDSSSTAVASSSSSSLTPQPFDFPESHFFYICFKAVNLKSQVLYGSQESELEFSIRKRVMEFMNVSEEDYTMVFTSNQSSAFKLLSNSYPFQSNRNLLTVYDFKSEAVQIMTENTKRRGARVLSAEYSWPSMRIQTRKLRNMIVSASSSSNYKKKVRNKKGLFVFPLQSRMTGSRYSYLWMSIARENGWHVLLDACALGPKDMETLGLSLFKPDFLICSFYKVFGENPSGFGCLFVKKTSASLLTDLSAAESIGIVSLVPASTQLVPHHVAEDQDQDQDNTENDQEPKFDSAVLKDDHDQDQDKVQSSEIIELETQKPSGSKLIKIECKGLDHADSLGLVLISARARFLINWLVNALTRLKHPNSENGHSLIRIYGPKMGFDRGPSVAFNVFDWQGEKINPKLVQKLADRNNISLSCGFLQNVCFCDKNEEEKERRLETTCVTSNIGRKNIDHIEMGEEKVLINKERDEIEESGISAITASLGLVTNFEDIYRLWAFVARFLDADFVEKERWRYLALNQTTVEV